LPVLSCRLKIVLIRSEERHDGFGRYIPVRCRFGLERQAVREWTLLECPRASPKAEGIVATSGPG